MAAGGCSVEANNNRQWAERLEKEVSEAIGLLNEVLKDRENANWNMGTDWVKRTDAFIAKHKETRG